MTDNKIKKTLSLIYLLAGIHFMILVFTFGHMSDDELGANVYKKRCQMCHAADSSASTKAGKAMKTPDITKKVWKNGKSVEDLEKTLREGLGKMPAYSEKLTDEELTAVASFVVEKFGASS